MEATYFNSSELADLEHQYQSLHQWLRRGIWLIAGAALPLLAFLLLDTYRFELGLYSRWPAYYQWMREDFALFGIQALNADRGLYIIFTSLGIGYVGGLSVIYLAVRRRRIRKQFLRVSQGAPPIVDASTSMGLADQPADQDALGFDTLAQAVSGLLRHPATQAPYTLVLSGGWGSGKSSLMTQVRRLLSAPGTRPGFQSLWFNVWHFQSEQHLLTTFLGTILARCEELPGFYRRLWWQRFLDQGFWEALRTAFVFSLLLPAFGGLAYALLHQALGSPAGEAGVTATAQNLLGQTDRTALLALLTAWAGAAWSLLKAWQERANLLAGLIPLERFRLEAARADPGFRRKYQQEFRQLMRATPPGTRFLVCIDDVDRIPGARVLELLESINFISDTAGQSEQERANTARLYFVLGMYVPEVARTLGTALDVKSKMDDAVASRHAARYLAKLVDLVVPLPSLQHCSPAQLYYLLFGSAAAPADSSSTPVAR